MLGSLLSSSAGPASHTLTSVGIFYITSTPLSDCVRSHFPEPAVRTLENIGTARNVDMQSAAAGAPAARVHLIAHLESLAKQLALVEMVEAELVVATRTQPVVEVVVPWSTLLHHGDGGELGQQYNVPLLAAERCRLEVQVRDPIRDLRRREVELVAPSRSAASLTSCASCGVSFSGSQT